MKIKRVELKNFKRFTHLNISNVPESAKLVVLLGPNGCGKSSLFDAFKAWHRVKGYGRYTGDDYYNKISDTDEVNNQVHIEYYTEDSSFTQKDYRKFFYFRTAYRNSPKITVRSLQKLASPLEGADDKLMIDNDDTVNDNYQRLITLMLTELLSVQNNDKTVETLRRELVGRVSEILNGIFSDLALCDVGSVNDDPNFYFNKGSVAKYSYEKLSGGEKSVFDIILDMIVKSKYFDDSIFCIDEPEIHVHTRLQSKLLRQLCNLIPDNSQLWIATHSFGILKESVKINNEHPGKVAFIDLDGYDFDGYVEIEPTTWNAVVWPKILDVSFDDYCSFVSPKVIVLCEGSQSCGKRSNFDARCYENIFSRECSSVLFFSACSCEDIKRIDMIVNFIKIISPQSRVIRLRDRDDLSDEEVKDHEGVIKTLSRRSIESYLLDDDVLIKWCKINEKYDLVDDVLEIKRDCISKSIERGNPKDDIKSASNEIVTLIKRRLHLTQCGNNGAAIMRDTVSKLITQDMKVYQELKKDIFG